ncbi:MAG: hypothetical protein FWC41_04325 [Firmicutes bacterium]|nr:hypothetical protein [Bacillota bacterium]
MSTVQIWQCEKCGKLCEFESSSPSTQPPKDLQLSNSRCTNHSWKRLGQKGNKLFVCKKCGMTVYTATRPMSAKCQPPIKSGTHSWG